MTGQTDTTDPQRPPSMTLVVPAYNEEELLASTVGSLLETLKSLDATFEIVIVDDGSADATPQIADRLARDHDEVSVVHQANQGIGAALKAGIDRASLEYVALWPADMPCEVDDMQPYLAHLGKASVVVGCRRRRPEDYNLLMRFNAMLYPYIVRLLFGLRLRDVNWICVYQTDLAKRVELTQKGIPMLTEILVKIRDLGGTFCQIDVVMKPRASGVASASRFKVMWRTLTGLVALWWGWRRGRKPLPAGSDRAA